VPRHEKKERRAEEKERKTMRSIAKHPQLGCASISSFSLPLPKREQEKKI
jgi:hypothetical protein